MYKNKVLKKIYLLYYRDYFPKRMIAQKIKNENNISYSIEKICNDISNIFPERIRSKDFLDIEKRYILYMYKNFSNTKKLVDHINSKGIIHIKMTERSVRRLAEFNGVKKTKRKKPINAIITKADELNIVKRYIGGESSYKIAKDYNVKTEKSILDTLDRYGIQRRAGSDAYFKNNSFDFEIIDSEFKAYYLGLLLTDGYILLNQKRHGILLEMTDKDVIKFVSINTGGTFYQRPIRNEEHKIMYRTQVTHSKFRSQLNRLGIVPKKSRDLKGPNLHESEMQYIPYIMRGIIDGDGWVRKDGKEFFICSASSDFIEWCNESLLKIGMKNLNINSELKDNKPFYYLRSAIKSNIIILKEIYKEPFGMARKYNRLHKDVQRL